MAGRAILGCIALVAPLLAAPAAGATPAQAAGGAAEHWTAARRATATPRDLVIDERGLGYLRRADGSLQPHGHATPNAQPSGGDRTGPTISGMDPGANATIGTSHTFKATVSDPSGVRSVSFVLVYPDGRTQAFSPTRSGDIWSVGLSGFTAGPWWWYVTAKDAVKGGNTSTTAHVPFTVATDGGGGSSGGAGGGGGVVTNAEWTAGGAVQTAAGRIYFEMPTNSRKTRWEGYVCSGTAAEDSTLGRSVIITAAHCVYDDVYKTFARNVLFIPDQANSTSGTDVDCGNDRFGCWKPSFGVVDSDWTTRTFPDNIPWDYAYYVVSDMGAHSGTSTSSEALDQAVGSLPVQFDPAPTVGNVTHALGYSYSEDPSFMYCAEAMTTEGTANWWLPSCGLSGGSSGGPWVQPMGTTGSGPIISVNSWGYTSQAGMAGPKLTGSASCLFNLARSQLLTTTGGVAGC